MDVGYLTKVSHQKLPLTLKAAGSSWRIEETIQSL